jgi:hypothetical protein
VRTWSPSPSGAVKRVRVGGRERRGTARQKGQGNAREFLKEAQKVGHFNKNGAVVLPRTSQGSTPILPQVCEKYGIDSILYGAHTIMGSCREMVNINNISGLVFGTPLALVDMYANSGVRPRGDSSIGKSSCIWEFNPTDERMMLPP